MTPKESYEARKAEREKLKELDHQVRDRTEQMMFLDTLDRLATSFERIAIALEEQTAHRVHLQTQTHGIQDDPRF